MDGLPTKWKIIQIQNQTAVRASIDLPGIPGVSHVIDNVTFRVQNGGGTSSFPMVSVFIGAPVGQGGAGGALLTQHQMSSYNQATGGITSDEWSSDLSYVAPPGKSVNISTNIGAVSGATFHLEVTGHAI